MTDKEIALELTKAYLEHLNARVSVQAMKSHASVETTSTTYQYFHDVISKIDEGKE